MIDDIFYPSLQLLLHLPKLEQRVIISALGCQKNLFLLANLPYLNEKPVKLKSEDNCIIRFLKEDDALFLGMEFSSISKTSGDCHSGIYRYA